MQPRYERIVGVLTAALVCVCVVLWLLLVASPPPVHAQQAQGARDCQLTASAQVCTLSVIGAGAVAVQLDGTWTGTMNFEGTLNGTFVALNLVPSNSATAATSATANGAWNGNVGGYRTVQVRASALSAGIVLVSLGSATSGGK